METNHRSKKAKKSKSPGSMNRMFHHAMTPNKSSSKKKIFNSKGNLKSPSKLDTSKHSNSSKRSINRSRSLHVLPFIPGNDIKTIKKIFLNAKKYREKHGQQKIAVKIMPKMMKSSPKPPRSTRSIPKTKKSSDTIHSLLQHIGKLISKKSIIVLFSFKPIEKPSKTDVEYLKVNNANSSNKKSAMSLNDSEMHNNASCPQLQEISESKFETKSKFSHKSKNSPPKYKYKYGVQRKGTLHACIYIFIPNIFRHYDYFRIFLILFEIS